MHFILPVMSTRLGTTWIMEDFHQQNPTTGAESPDSTSPVRHRDSGKQIAGHTERGGTIIKPIKSRILLYS